jgi:ATP-dependent helicase HrpB
VAVLRGEVRNLPPGITVDHRALSQAARSSAHGSATSRVADRTRRIRTSGPGYCWHGLTRSHRPARGDGGRYLLANGRGARFAEPQALSKAEFIVAAELDGAEREARIFLAAPVTLSDLEQHFSAQILDHGRDTLGRARAGDPRAARAASRRAAAAVDRDSQSRQRRRCRRGPHRDCGNSGIAGLPWTPELRQWQARVMLMREFAVASPEPWPDLGDAALTRDSR